jgi:flagellar protein FliS
MTLLNAEKARAEYVRKSVQSATPAQLVVMLFDRALLDLARAERAQEQSDFAQASTQLIHAQAIVAELASALNTETWEGAAQLLSIYNFVGSEMVRANVEGDVRRTRECIRILGPIGDGFRQAAEATAAGSPELVARGIA